MAISEGYRKNFETLQRAFDNGHCALMECTDAKTGQTVIAVCAVGHTSGGEFEFFPLAKMFDGNPYRELNPPGMKEED